jgi:hypothetical protein
VGEFAIAEATWKPGSTLAAELPHPIPATRHQRSRALASVVQPPPCPPGPPRWLTWGRERIEKLEQDHHIEVEYLIGPNAAARFFACGRSVKYGWNKRTGKTLLLKARFCGYWFCPLCELRRKSVLKRRAEVATKQLQKAIPSLRWVKLHLTVPNCEGDDLRETIDAMFEAFRSMVKSKAWPGQGAIRCLEVTRGEEGTAHPHLHVSIATKAGYFNGQNYWSEDRWQQEWEKALGTKAGRYVKTQNAKDEEEASDLVDYSQKPPDEDEILWRMRAWKQMYNVRRVECYGAVKLPPSRIKKAPVAEESPIGEKPKNRIDVVTYSWNGKRDEPWKVKVGMQWWS